MSSRPKYQYAKMSNGALGGYLKEIRNDPLSLIHEASLKGDIVSYRIGHRRVYGVHHPDLVKEILLTRHESFVKKGIYTRLRVIFRNSLFTSMGALWKRQRRTMQPMFAKHNMEALVNTMFDEVSRFRDELEARSKKGEEIDIYEEMLHVTMRIIVATMFSKDVPDEREAFSRCIYVLNSYAVRALYSISPPLTWMPTPLNNEYRKAFRVLDDIIQKIIDKRISSGEFGDDLLGMLLSSKDPDTGEGMSMKQMREEAVTMFAAGHETTATALAWTYHLINKNPDVKSKMFAEIDSFIPSKDSRVGADEIKKLSYVDQMFSESMRMYSPVWMIYRQVEHDLTLGGVSLKRGDTVYVSPYLCGRDERFWKNPSVYDPSRFGSGSDESFNRFSYVPFGGGPRSCIGSHFSMLESNMILSVLGKSFDFVADEGREIKEEPLITLKPRDPISMKIVRR